MELMESNLIGKKILSVSKLGRDTLDFEVTEGLNIHWYVEGDCCSEGMFTDIIGDATKLFKIKRIVELPMVNHWLNPKLLSKQEQHQEVEQIYGLLVIDQYDDQVLVVHRNWSNGYYGNCLIEDGKGQY